VTGVTRASHPAAAGGAPRYLGVDLAWRDSTPERPANETGLAVVEADGTVLDAGWARGVDAVEEWVLRWATPGSVVAIDAPVLVPNATGMRASEREVSRSYGRWHVAANASSASLPWLGGRDLGERLERAGLVLDDGVRPVPEGRSSYFECYPYTTLVGAAELGYDERRPRYKRPDTTLPREARREARAAACDDLLRRLDSLATATPALRLRSHPVSRLLLDEPISTARTCSTPSSARGRPRCGRRPPSACRCSGTRRSRMRGAVARPSSRRAATGSVDSRRRCGSRGTQASRASQARRASRSARGARGPRSRPG
jgi:hypothetical protein